MINLEIAYRNDKRFRFRNGRYEWRDPTWFGVRWAQIKWFGRKLCGWLTRPGV